MRGLCSERPPPYRCDCICAVVCGRPPLYDLPALVPRPPPPPPPAAAPAVLGGGSDVVK